MTQSDQPALQTWWLEPYISAKQATSDKTLPLVRISVTVVPGLDTNRILTLTGNAELKKYTAARWADNLPELLSSLVGRSLEASGRFDVVSDQAGAISEDCNLQLEASEFYADLGLNGRTTGVSVALDGNYQCGSDERMPIQLSTSMPVHGESISEIVAAFQRAMDSVMAGLLAEIQTS
jgi:ABC-type uncharacterized transport system auxiliary subunit